MYLFAAVVIYFTVDNSPTIVCNATESITYAEKVLTVNCTDVIMKSNFED